MPSHCSQDYRSNLKALYTGRYQQTKEQGIKRTAQRMARPRPTPLPEGSTQNMAREDTTLKSSVAAQTKQSRRVEKRRFYYSQQHWLLHYTHAHDNSLFHTNKDLADVMRRYLLLLCLLLVVKLVSCLALWRIKRFGFITRYSLITQLDMKYLFITLRSLTWH